MRTPDRTPSTAMPPRIAAAALVFLASTPAAAAWPPWLERWLFNSDRLTERGIESFEQGDAGAAVEPLEIALRLERDDPRVLYNAGAARLGAGRSDAQSLLEAAAEAGSGELAPRASYNLGNARMAAENFSGAIEAYQQSLRQDSEFEDAKYNLELARRKLEQERQERQQQETPQQQQETPRQEPPRQEQEQQPQRQEQQPRDGAEPPPAGEDPKEQQEPDRGPRQESPLPRFRDQPDMSAEEAAAILEAIENMEREDRRRKALEAGKQRRAGGRDW